MDVPSFAILLLLAGVFGYCGGKKHGFHLLLKSMGLDLTENK